MKTFGKYWRFGLILLLLSGCRDYITGINSKQSPVLSTNSSVYGIQDTITVTLTNSSFNKIYVKGVYNVVEKEIQNNWGGYASIECNNCAENELIHGQFLVHRGIVVNDPGTFRLICYYGLAPGLADQYKVKLYSNTFTVQ